MLQVENNKHQHLLMKATEKQLKIYKVKIIYSVYKKNSINYLDIQHRNETIQSLDKSSLASAGLELLDVLQFRFNFWH